jgi:dTDP-4-dehydrorhamnose reductase
MLVLITGGSGQLGLAIKRELALQNIKYVSPTSSQLDVTKEFMVNDQLKNLKPTVIVNCAAWTDVDLAESNQEAAFLVNAYGPKNLAIAARNIGAELIQISTDYVFSGESEVPWNEFDPHAPLSIYGNSKSAGEALALKENSECTYIIRTAWLYSEFRRNFAMTMTKLALNGVGMVPVVNDQIGQPTYSGDLANQIVKLLVLKSPIGIYHATNSGQASWYEFASEIFKHVGADISRLTPVSSSEFLRPAKRPKFSVLSHSTWGKTGTLPMRDWKIALADAMPSIILNTKVRE